MGDSVLTASKGSVYRIWWVWGLQNLILCSLPLYPHSVTHRIFQATPPVISRKRFRSHSLFMTSREFQIAVSTKEVTAIWLGGGWVTAMGMGPPQGDPHSIVRINLQTQ